MDKFLNIILNRLIALESWLSKFEHNMYTNDDAHYVKTNSNTQHITETEEAMCETYEEQTMTNLEVQEALVELYEMIES